MFLKPLDKQLYASWYKLRKNASTMSHNQNNWFAAYAMQLKDAVSANKKEHLSVLSIGAGEGDNDLLWAKSLSQHFNSIEYHVIEPNAIHAKLFCERVENCGLDNVSFSFYPLPFEHASEITSSVQGFDLIHFVHCIHLLKDAIGAVARARTLLNPDGRIVIIQQSGEGVPRLHQLFLPSLMGEIVASLSAEDLSTQLEMYGIPHRIELIDAHLDVTECVHGTAQGQHLLSFMMGCDIRQLDAQQLSLMLMEIEKMSAKHIDNTYQLHEPVAVIEICNNLPMHPVH